jgi:hypothetical protein
MKFSPRGKKALRIAAAAAVPVYLAVFLLFIFPGLSAKEEEPVPPGASVLRLWHVDLFEGGSGSRAEFLKSRALEFEKGNKNTFIQVKSMTLSQLENDLADGRMPDLISYGAGLAGTILPDLAAFGGSIQAYDNIFDSGVAENKLYAVPWCTGAYMTAAVSGYLDEREGAFSERLASSPKTLPNRTVPSFLTGGAAYTNPLLAAYAANPRLRLSENSFDASAGLTQYEAYQRFVSKTGGVFLLGTQRDAVRLAGRDDAAEFLTQALPGFTDLVCYISLTRVCGQILAARTFIEYLLSEKSQYKLGGIHMFSVNYEGLYTEGILADMERSIGSAKVLNAFTAGEILEEYREAALFALRGDGESIKKLDSLF